MIRSSNRADANLDHTVSTDELRDYVIEKVPEATYGIQHPVVDRDNLYMLFHLPVITPGEVFE